jgi:hypothetical protein
MNANPRKVTVTRLARPILVVVTAATLSFGAQHASANAAPEIPAPTAPTIVLPAAPADNASPKPAPSGTAKTARPSTGQSNSPSADRVMGGTWTPWGIIYRVIAPIWYGQYSCKVAKCANA